MDVQITEEQGMLRDSVAKFCQNEIPLEKVRELADDPVGLPDALWMQIAEQGWLGLLIPEEHGGIGLGVTEQAIVCEEMGRALLPGPYLSTVLAAYAISKAGTETAKGAWLEKIVAGEARGTLALLEESAQLAPRSVHTRAIPSDEGYLLNGKKFLVEDAVAADFYIVAARTDEGDDGTTLFVVAKDTPGVSVAPNKLTDLTSRSGQVTLENVAGPSDNVLGTPDAGLQVVDVVLAVSNVFLAGACVTGSEYILKLTVDYAKERTQFGKLIGTFQAVKHPLAYLFAYIESSRSAYHYAAWAADAKSEDKRCAAAIACLSCTETFRKTTLDCLQAHGGIGFTWEYDLHLFLKRAKHNQNLLGMPRDYEEIVATEALGI